MCGRTVLLCSFLSCGPSLSLAAYLGGGRWRWGFPCAQYDAIPVEVNGEDAAASRPIEWFHELQGLLPEFASRNVGLMRYARPTPIQRHAIPLALAGKDLMCCAQTGSGKTCAFLLPIVSALGRGDRVEQRPDPSGPAASSALVMAPTRELVLQIHLESRKLCNRSGLSAVVVYGGAPARGQLQQLAQGADVLVATPGRLIDFVDRGVISLACTRFLVLDEADRMLDMGFEPQIRQVVQKRDMPDKELRQTLMFSATFPSAIQRLAGEFMRGYVWIAVGRVGSSVEAIQQHLVLAPPDKAGKLQLALQAIAGEEGRTLVFVQKKATADWVCRSLRREGIGADSIHGDRNQAQREGALLAFREGRTRVLVATDVAARGLDIPQVPPPLPSPLA